MLTWSLALRNPVLTHFDKLVDTPRMQLDDAHHFLTTQFELLPDTLERGNARSYFWRHIDWHPASTTRVLRVHHESGGAVTRIQLCVSSDNNNSVFLLPPFSEDGLRARITEEIAYLRPAASSTAASPSCPG